jgi:hypothetical protein
LIRNVAIFLLCFSAVSCKQRRVEGNQPSEDFSLADEELYDPQTGKCSRQIPKAGNQGDSESYECALVTDGGQGAYINNLRGAHFVGKLTMAFFMNADLSGADFSDLTEVSHVTFDNCTVDKYTKMPKSASCEPVANRITDCVIEGK